MQLDIPIVPLLALVGVEIGSNLACALLARRRRPRQAWLAAVMGLDVLLFSGLLYLTGGPLNPFSFLYLIPIALASITVRAGLDVGAGGAVARLLGVPVRDAPAAVARRSRAPHEPAPARHVGRVRGRRVVHRLLPAARAARAGASRARAGRRAGGGAAPGAAGVAGDAGGGGGARAADAAVDDRGDRGRSAARSRAGGGAGARRRGRAAGARRGRSLPRDHRTHARRRRRHGG